jgi:hypothetical protein
MRGSHGGSVPIRYENSTWKTRARVQIRSFSRGYSLIRWKPSYITENREGCFVVKSAILWISIIQAKIFADWGQFSLSLGRGTSVGPICHMAQPLGGCRGVGLHGTVLWPPYVAAWAPTTKPRMHSMCKHSIIRCARRARARRVRSSSKKNPLSSHESYWWLVSTYFWKYTIL